MAVMPRNALWIVGLTIVALVAYDKWVKGKF